eukprot:10126582-Heterocapsa_arctica.AAC.1
MLCYAHQENQQGASSAPPRPTTVPTQQAGTRVPVCQLLHTSPRDRPAPGLLPPELCWPRN